MSLKRQRILINIAIVLTLAAGTTIAILFAKGYRPNFQNKQFEGTGLLSLTSYPKTAQVFIDDRLTTVTDDRLYLSPGSYKIKIVKQGFHPWEKEIPIKNESVSETNARLFPVIPATTPLTFYRVETTQVSHDTNHLAFTQTQSPFQAENGLYTLSLSGNLLSSSNQITQIADNSTLDFSKSQLLWSPDNSQILAIFTESKTNSKTQETTYTISSSYLLSTKGMNNNSQLVDVTVRLPLILSQWQSQLAKLDQAAYTEVPESILQILTDKSNNVYFSPDKEKVLYSPQLDLDLPENETGKKLPNYNATPETRSLKANSLYVYDIKEGTNYLIAEGQNTNTVFKTLIAKSANNNSTATGSADNSTTAPLDSDPLSLFTKLRAQTDSTITTNLRWFSDSKHLLLISATEVQVVDYDNLNSTNLLSSPIKESLAISSPDGNRLVTLTNLNQKPDTFNLFSLDLK